MHHPPGSAFPGQHSYNLTPYWREPVDCMASDHPARKITIKKGAQTGCSACVLIPIVGWTIAENPGNMLFLTGHSDLSDELMVKIDHMIDNCGIRKLIRPSIQRTKNSKTGDTNKGKDFSGGTLITGSSTNHKLLMQRDIMIMLVDDLDAAPPSSKSDGSTQAMIEQRLAAYYNKMKLYSVSTPRLEQSSNIEPLFLKGDQRLYHIPCTCCGEAIPLVWSINVDDKNTAGIYYKTDTRNRLIKNSVGYVCQKCGNFFDDKQKYEQNLSGVWVPTVDPLEDDHQSYHLPSLYAPPGMYDWRYYVTQFLNANPIGAPQKKAEQQTFVNLCLGDVYRDTGEAPKADTVQQNIRSYQPGIIPEALSVRDGNGKIVLLTCACDLNGVPDDARLDYEVVAWSQSGSSYSVIHGSIGTFIPRENSIKNKVDRERWTYEHNRPKSVWPELTKILKQVWTADNGRKMRILITGVDTGHYNTFAYPYIDTTKSTFIVGLKGDKVDKFIQYGVDVKNFKPAKERANLYLAQVNQVKDQISELINLKWDSGNDDHQPPGFMNYPQPTDGLYLLKNYFSHYESEHRIVESKDGKSIASRWEKKMATSQNHFWDVRVYNFVLKDIMVYLIAKEAKIKDFTWADFAEAMLPKK